MGVRTQGTQLYMRFQDSSGYSIVQIGCPTGITGLGGGGDQLDDTCLDDVEMKYLRGMPKPGAIQVALNYDTSKISHQQLWDLFESGDVVDWVIGFPDGKNIAPTVDNATGVITFPDTRTFVEFEGYVADLPLDFAINALIKSNMSVQRTGPRTRHDKA